MKRHILLAVDIANGMLTLIRLGVIVSTDGILIFFFFFFFFLFFPRKLDLKFQMLLSMKNKKNTVDTRYLELAYLE